MKNTLVNKDAKLIIGSPGCGKTTRLMEIIEQDLASGIRINEIGFVSFSTAAINEALTRLGKKFGIRQGNVAYFKTLHSMGFLFLDYKRNQTLTPGKLANFGASVGLNLSNRGFKDREADGFATEDDKLLQLINISRLFGCTLEEAAAYHGMIGKVDVGKAKLVKEMYEAYKYQKGLHDFTDMIYNAVHQDCPIPFLKRLIVDEAQDLSRLQWELVFKMAENADSIVIAGDDKQCQPTGTKVLTSNGFKNIEDLIEGKDKLVSYARNDSQCYGFKRGYDFKIQAHKYTGPMYTLISGDAKTKATDKHKWLVKWKNNKDTDVSVVYLMQRGDNFRIGWCQLFDASGALHLSARARIEKAERVWILKACRNKSEASVWEKIYAADSGLPQVTFEPVKAAKYFTKDNLDFIFSKIACQKLKAQELLDRLHRDINVPFWINGTASRYGSTIFECHSINLIPELMMIPIMLKPKYIEWCTFILNREWVYDKTVYGIDVEPYHTYITDNNIITHNCINNFAGADIETFLNLGIPVEALEQSYRIPINVHKLALSCLDHIGERYEVKWKPKPEEGNVFRISSLPYREIMSSKETWMILSRNKSSINKLVEYLYFMKFPFSVNRQPPFDAILYTCIKNFNNYKSKKKELSDAQKRIIDSYMVGGIEMLDEHEDWQSAFRGHLDGDLEGYLEYCLENDLKDKDFVNARVRLSTIHSAKGSEADNVVLINEFSEAVEENLIYEPETEYKILFVAVTRAKHNLFILETDSKRRYRI